MNFSAVFSLIGATLLLILSGCGGGASTSSSGSGDGGSVPATAALQTRLGSCPVATTINQVVPCMSGQYQGKTTDTGDLCSFVYGSDGVANYTAGGQLVRATLAITSSGAVFEKKLANNSAGFSISWAVGIASGNDMNLSFQLASEPGSASGLFVKPKKAGVPSCLITAGPTPAATGASSTANLLGRTWQTPQLLNGTAGGLAAASGEAAFAAGLADDGRAFVAFRQVDSSGRLAVQVVEGTPGGAGQNPSWTAPLVLDDAAPLLAGGFRPAIAVSANGHAVVLWATQRACESDGYNAVNAGKTCRYVYASRRLASATSWEAPLRVAAAPLANSDYFAKINTKGDVALVFNGAQLPEPGRDYTPGSIDDRVLIARRQSGEAAYRVDRSTWLRRTSSLRLLSEWVHVELGDDGNIVIAGETNSTFGAILHTTTDMTQALVENAGLTQDSAYGVYQSSSSGGGFSAYTWKSETGPYNPLKPQQLTIYSPDSQRWLTSDITVSAQWGDTVLVGTDSSAGEFLLYSGCKLSVWRAGVWQATRDLPSYCGRDQTGGRYAFNRKGDYLGLNWAGQAGQWGFYSYAQDKLLKGAPGSGVGANGDYVLGTASPLFGAEPTQVLLAANGLALAITSNPYTSLPSPANPVGVNGNSLVKLWGIYLR